MTFWELPSEERISATKMIHNIIGTKESWLKENMDLSQKINTRARYDKMFEKLAKIYVKSGAKALAITYTDCGGYKYGTTPNGKKWYLEMNEGWTERSRHCGTLRIDKEVLFTSGTIAKAFEYILNN